MSQTPKIDRYAPRVQVLSTSGRYLYRTHAAHAAHLVSLGAKPEVSAKQKRIFRIILNPPDGIRTGPPTKPHPRMFGTAAPVYSQRLEGAGTSRLMTYTFKHIPPADVDRILLERPYVLKVARVEE